MFGFFHDRVIERNSRQLRETFMQNLVEIFRRPDLRDKVGQFRSVAIEFAQDSWHRPDKHSGVPAKISFSQKGLGQIDIRLFAKADDAVNSDFSAAAQSHRLTLLDVTETGASPGWFDSNRYERDRFLQQSSFGNETQQLLGTISPAQRPKTLTAAAGKNERINRIRHVRSCQ